MTLSTKFNSGKTFIFFAEKKNCLTFMVRDMYMYIYIIHFRST